MSHRIETVARIFQERDHEVRTEKQAHLFRAARGIELGNSSHEEKILAILFDFGALMNMDHIFQSQRVELKELADFLNRRGAAQTVHVDPDDGILRQQFIHAGEGVKNMILLDQDLWRRRQ